jgi:LysM repeat protein
MQATALNLFTHSTVSKRKRTSMRARRRLTLGLLGGLVILLTVFVLAPKTVFMLGRADAAALQSYTVAPGDTLWEIADQYSNGQDVRKLIYTIKQTNHLQTANVIPGQVLLIPQYGAR